MEGRMHPAVHPIAPPPRMPRRRHASVMLRATLLLACATAAAIAPATAAAGAPGPMAGMLGRMLADKVLQDIAETADDITAARRCAPDVTQLARGAQASLEVDFAPEQRLRLDMVARSSVARRIEARVRNARLEAMDEDVEPLPEADPKDVEVMAAFDTSPLGQQFDAWLRSMEDRDDAPMQRAVDAAERACLTQKGR